MEGEHAHVGSSPPQSCTCTTVPRGLTVAQSSRSALRCGCPSSTAAERSAHLRTRAAVCPLAQLAVSCSYMHPAIAVVCVCAVHPSPPLHHAASRPHAGRCGRPPRHGAGSVLDSYFQPERHHGSVMHHARTGREERGERGVQRETTHTEKRVESLASAVASWAQWLLFSVCRGPHSSCCTRFCCCFLRVPCYCCCSSLSGISMADANTGYIAGGDNGVGANGQTTRQPQFHAAVRVHSCSCSVHAWLTMFSFLFVLSFFLSPQF